MPSKVYKIDETSQTWGSEVGDDHALTSESVSDGAGRWGAQWDRGAGGTARTNRFFGRLWTQAVATPTLKELLELHKASGDGTHYDHDDGTGDIAMSAEDKLANAKYLSQCSPVVDQAAANIEFSRGDIFFHDERYMQPGIFNNMGSATTADAAETKFIVTPMPLEAQ